MNIIVHTTQAGRRGDAPQFLSICHVLEFEPIYRYEAVQRQVKAGERGKEGGRGHKKPSSTNGAEGLGKGRWDMRHIVAGPTRDFMARDSAASKNSVERVLYIREIVE